MARVHSKVAGRRRSGGLAAFVLSVAAIVPFLSSLSGYFLSDDFGLIGLFWQKPPLHFLALFTSPWTETIYGYRTDELRPLVALSYQVDAAWGAASPFAYHVSSILFHVLNALLVLTIARRVAGLSLLMSCLAGVLFAVMPVHVETVAWISGRADSIPTIFYLTSFLTYALWRGNARGWLYWASIVSFFFALFSKQSAITMLGTLVLYDALVLRRWPWASWRQVMGYVPYAALTLGYLGLRLALFENAVREQLLTVGRLTEFWQWQVTYLQMVVSGIYIPRANTIVMVIAPALCLLSLYAAVRALRRPKVSHSGIDWAVLFYFGPVWWTVAVAPLVVTTYLSSRHLYLASVGLAIVLGLAFEALWSARRGLMRYAVALAGASLVVGYTLTLVWAVGQWNATAALSEKIVRDVEQEAAAAPEGSLLLLDVAPGGPTPRVWTWLWGWALPYALQPPFTRAGLMERVSIVSRPEVYCCLPEQWYEQTQRSLAEWFAAAKAPPVITLAWDNSTGALIRRSEVEQRGLRNRVMGLADAPSSGAMSAMLDDVLRQHGGG